MELFRDGVAAFLEAVGIAAVLWVLFDWVLRPKRGGGTAFAVPPPHSRHFDWLIWI